MKKIQKPQSSSKDDDALQHNVSYEEIMDILNRRRDYERFGDNDTY